MNVEKDDMLKAIQNQVESYLSGRTVRLAEVLEKQTGKETRVTILGHVQRGGTPSARDRVLSTALGARCAQEVAKGRWGYMMSVKGTEIVPFRWLKLSQERSTSLKITISPERHRHGNLPGYLGIATKRNIILSRLLHPW